MNVKFTTYYLKDFSLTTKPIVIIQTIINTGNFDFSILSHEF